MIRLKFNQSRSPTQNIRWASRHGICLIALIVIFIAANKIYSSLDQIFFGLFVVATIYSACYFLGYIVISAFWLASARFPWLAIWYKKYNPAIDDIEIWRQNAINEFKITKINSANANLQLDGSKAEILKIEKCGESLRPQRLNFSINTYSRNDAGEYFLFKKSGTEKPYVKHIEKSVAEKILKPKSTG
ncbi:hypothetical protein [Aquabacterium sp.]|uniref:hypothetical protein n=1 Tax=Aquabacterium sp. TaxID=1872578 RepID=UPI00248734A4|nr:hypothetical protein [Aquabacterium sp.]MDI1349569.1 hypothetical protein [Aquabacterium sp.]